MSIQGPFYQGDDNTILPIPLVIPGAAAYFWSFWQRSLMSPNEWGHLCCGKQQPDSQWSLDKEEIMRLPNYTLNMSKLQEFAFHLRVEQLGVEGFHLSVCSHL